MCKDPEAGGDMAGRGEQKQASTGAQSTEGSIVQDETEGIGGG